LRKRPTLNSLAFFEELGLVEFLVGARLGQRGRGAGDQRQVGKTDLSAGHRLRALGHVLQLLANRDSITRGSPAHVTVEPDPMDG
jgi:hypothetical protein